MTVVSTIAELREAIGCRVGPVGLVPTMGALHAGHIRLLETAHSENQTLVCSIFVNPLQFDRNEDLARYPRTLGTDLDTCRQHHVDLVFTPTPAELYPRLQLTFVDVPSLSENLCGLFRPGHFRGVCTVVMKLFQIVAPKRAYFGQKDAQQLAIIRRMTEDLNLPIEIVSVPTVREPDGLALSSRNRHLNPEERAIAPRLYQALERVADALDRGERSTTRLREFAHQIPAGVKVEYFDLVDPDTLSPLSAVEDAVLVAGAIWLGQTRLIDNVIWRQ